MGEPRPQKEKPTKQTATYKNPTPGSRLTLTGAGATGATIRTKDKSGANLIYEDPNTASTIASKQAREGIADGGNYNVLASTSAPAGIGGAVDTSVKAGSVVDSGPKIDLRGETVSRASEQERVLINTYNPRPSKDRLTGDTLRYRDRTSRNALMSPALRRALFGGTSSILRRINFIK